MSEAFLSTFGLSKSYGRNIVLRDIDIEFRSGEIHGLLGANGAGKSTLCKIISGLTQASAGRMKIGGVDFSPFSKQAAEQAGVEIVQQELNLIENLSVAENLFLTRLPSLFGNINRFRLNRNARNVLDRFGLQDLSTYVAVRSLGVGQQQMLEIAKSLARECRLLILDEPTAALTQAESERLFEQLRELRMQGVAIIYISHRLDEVLSLTDRVSILRDGELVRTDSTEKIDQEAIIRSMSGPESHSSSHAFKSYMSDAVALKVSGIESGFVQDVSFEARRGERVGITGLIGSGRTELLRAIFGADKATAGEVQVGSGQNRARFNGTYQAVSAGLAMVTEDRKQTGVLLRESIRSNMTLSCLYESFSRFGFVSSAKEITATHRSIADLEIKCQHVEQSVQSLSGGNQQKVAIAKWIVRGAEVYLFDEPTRGIDVPARRRIYQLFEELVSQGKSIVIVSSDVDELLENCDRLLVMSKGRLVAEFERDNWDRKSITEAAFSEYTS